MQKVRFDFWYTLIFIALVGVGLSLSYSASSSEAIIQGKEIDFYFKNTIKFMVIGLVAGYLVAIIKYDFLTKFIIPLNIANVIFLMLTYLPQFQVVGGGAGRWLDLGIGVTFQPSELAKITVIFTLSYMIHKYRNNGTLNKLNSFKEGILPLLGYIGVYAGLVFFQDHLSATALIVGVSLVLLIVGGMNLFYLVPVVGIAIVGGVIAIIKTPYRMKRIVGFTDPEGNIDGEGWQIVQGWYGLGSGGWNGLGFGMSRQKFGWIPEHHTDYIMGVIGEEIGFIGLVIIVSLFWLLLFRGVIVARKSKDYFGMSIITGISVLLFLQFALNLFVVTGMFPPTGVPVPFLSYGGSSTVVLFIMMGLIYNVYTTSKIEIEKEKEKEKEMIK